MILRLSAALVTTSLLAAQEFVPAPPMAGDDTVAASAGNQGNAAIAHGAGATLAVWEDDRSSRVDSVFGGGAANSSVPGNVDVFGVLLDQGGGPRTAAPIPIAAGPWDQRKPGVAWNGTDFLVVFESTQPTANFYSVGIYGVRVAPDGTVLDAAPIRIDDDPDLDERRPVVAAVGGRWLVAWEDVAATGLGVIRGRFVDSAGAVSAAVPLVSGTSGLPPAEIALAGSVNRAALAWSAGPGGGVFGQVLDGNAAPVGPQFALAPTSGGKPTVAASGAGFYVAWQNGASFGTPVSLGGGIAVPGGAQLAPIGASAAPDLDATFDGSDWVIGFVAPPSVHAIRVAPSGIVRSSTLVTTSPIAMPVTVGEVAVAGVGGATFVLWSDNRLGLDNIDPADVFSAVVSSAGVSAAQPVTTSTPAQVNAKISAAGPLGHLVVYEQQTSGVTRIMTRLVDAQGMPLLPQPFEVAAGDRKTSLPAVAWNGSEYLVTWGRLQSTATNGPPMLVEARRCDQLGAPIDPAPFVVMEGTAPAVAAVGSTFLVAAWYRHLQLQFTPVMRCRRVDGPTGALLDASPRLVGAGVQGGVRMVGLADRWLVAFSGVLAAFVLADGSPQQILSVGTDASAPAPRLGLCAAPTGSGACVVFEHKLASQFRGDVHMIRLAADGSALDPFDGVPVGTGIQAELRPAVAALDDGYLCLYADHRDSPEIEPGLGDVFARRIPFQGAPLDGPGIPVFDTPVAEGSVAVMRSDRGTALVVASALDPAHGVHRLQLTQYRSPSVTPWSTVGSGLRGTRGVPTLDGFGTLRPGEPFTVSVAGALPNAFCVTGLGVATANAPLLGGLVIPQPLLLVDTMTDATGSLVLGTTFPSGLSGISLYLQTWILDPTAVQGAAATAGLRGQAP